jgi:hypothetical protein
MPFRNCFARTFKAAAIRREAPPSSGVYGLSNARGWIYVGETDDIQARLLAHLEGPNPFAAHGAPTGFSFELSSPGQRIARQRQIIVEFDPPGNGDSRSMRRAF